MIVIHYEVHAGEGRFCPYFECDHCHNLILDPGEAIVTWGDEGAPRYLHKIRCDPRERRAEDKYWCSLLEHMGALLYNSGLKKEGRQVRKLDPMFAAIDNL